VGQHGIDYGMKKLRHCHPMYMAEIRKAIKHVSAAEMLVKGSK